MMNKPKFCYDKCSFLNPNEEEQNKMGNHKIPHFCKKYDKQVKHSGHHPKLVRLDECDVSIWETPKLEKMDLVKKTISEDEFKKEYCIEFDDDQKIDPNKSIELKTCPREKKKFICGMDLANNESDKSVTISMVNGTIIEHINRK